MNIDVVVITALGIEYEAVTERLSDVTRVRHPKGTEYEIGNRPINGRRIRAAVVEIGAGNVGAAVETERAIEYFDPSSVVFVGVAGGLKDVKLGDVVVGTKIYAYEVGKAGEKFKTRPEVANCSYEMVQLARTVRRGVRWREIVSETSVQAPNGREPEVFVGAIAAGQKVVGSRRAEVFRRLRDNYSDALAVEMEGYGVGRAVYANQALPFVVVRGISDLVEGKAKADIAGWQESAALNASGFFCALLEEWDKSSSKESPDVISGRRGSDGVWREIVECASELYPLGPEQDRIWERAGGDLSQINVGGSGKGAWYGAILEVRKGGGGETISLGSLVEEMRSDYPNSEVLAEVDDSLEHL